MAGEDYDRLTRICEQRSREFSRLEEAVHEYAAAERLDRPILSALRKHAERLESGPREFPGLLVGTIILQRVLGSETAERRFLNRTAYNPADPAAYEAMMTMPWRIAFLDIESRLMEGFFKVRELGMTGTRLLCSPSFERIETAGRPLILCGIYGDDACIQTFGPVLDLPAFDEGDIRAFARLAAPDSYTASGLGAVLSRDPLPFYLLTFYGQKRLSMSGTGELRYAASSFRCSESLMAEASKLAASSVSKGVSRIELGGTDRFDSFVTLVLEGKRRNATLVAASAGLYGEAARSPIIRGEAPAEPEYLATLPMVLAMESLLGKPFPGLRNRGGETPPGKSERKDADLDGLNAATREYFEAANTGMEKPDPRALAQKHGIDAASFADMVGRLEADFESKFRIDPPGGIEGFVQPSPSIKTRFAAPLSENQLFRIAADGSLDRELAAPGYAPVLPAGARGAITTARLAGLLERSTKPYFGVSARTALAYTLYLLLEKGETPRRTEAYGSELLKAFWQVLIRDPDESSIRDFLERYRMWVREVLIPYGLVVADDTQSIAAKDFAISRSALMERWIARRP